MFRIRKGKTFFKDRVKKLMRLKKNEKLKSLIENEETYSTMSDSTGTTLLHMAARYQNIDMMQYSIDSGCEIDAKDASGTTPLIVATKLHCLPAMTLLLRFSPNIFATNLAGEYPLQLMCNLEGEIYKSILEMYWLTVRSSSQSVEEAAEILMKAGYTLTHSAIMEDAEITRIFLDKMQVIDNRVCRLSVYHSMLHVDTVTLHLLISRGHRVAERIKNYFNYLDKMTHPVSLLEYVLFFGSVKFLEVIRVYATKIVDWNLVTIENLIYNISAIFRHADKDVLREFLESGIVSHAKTRVPYNLLPHIYSNPNAGVIELLQDMGLDLEARGSTLRHGETALHLTIDWGFASNVKLLLDAGSDPNSMMEIQGVTLRVTPLSCVLYSKQPLAGQIECLDLLLEYNADVEVGNQRGDCFFKYVKFDNEDHLVIAGRVLAHLAMLVETGPPLKQSVMDCIYNSHELSSRYETCQRQLDEMKELKIAGSFSLIKLLTSKPDKIARFLGAQDEEIIARLIHGESLNRFNGYYSKRLRDHLDRALKLDKLRTKMTQLIVENIATFRGQDLVVDRIIRYFKFEELLVFE